MKTALLVVSFGTSHLDTLKETILATEQAMAAAFPDFPVYRAFTSGMVRRSLLQKQQMQINSVEEALAQIAADGYERVIVQPTLLIPGAEYEKLCAAVYAAAGELAVLMGYPLLASEGDMDSVISVLQSAYPVASDTILLLMGHGTEHPANRLYEQMASKLRAIPDTAMRLCTVEASPSFEDALAELHTLPVRKILLAPFLFVAGDHTKNDMAGEEPDSLRSRLEAAGYEVHCVLQGLGQISQIRDLFIDRVKATHNCIV